MSDFYDVFLGLDVGKGEHHAVALAADGTRLYDAALPNSEPKLREVLDRLARHGRLLVVVDQPATIGALPVAVARAAGHEVAYLPGLAMRRIADLYQGNAKTDARDAYVVADAARTLPHALRMGAQLVGDILAALDEQTVVVPGTTAADTVLPRLADDLTTQRKTAAIEVERMLDVHPLAQVLTSMPGIGVKTAARILLEVGDTSAFASSAHLAAYASIAPVTHRSGSSICGERPARTGNRKLKRAFFLTAFAALSDPVSRAYDDKKRAESKKNNAALICLARRRCDVLFAMIRNKTWYRHPQPQTARQVP